MVPENLDIEFLSRFWAHRARDGVVRHTAVAERRVASVVVNGCPKNADGNCGATTATAGHPLTAGPCIWSFP